MKKSKIKYSDKLECFVARRKIIVDKFGRKRTFLIWRKELEPIELGSIKNPLNKDIVSIKWDKKRGDIGDAFRKLFGAFKGDDGGFEDD